MNGQDLDNAAYYLEIVMLDYLLKSKFISTEEYERILLRAKTDSGVLFVS